MTTEGEDKALHPSRGGEGEGEGDDWGDGDQEKWGRFLDQVAGSLAPHLEPGDKFVTRLVSCCLAFKEVKPS